MMVVFWYCCLVGVEVVVVVVEAVIADVVVVLVVLVVFFSCWCIGLVVGVGDGCGCFSSRLLLYSIHLISCWW